MGLNFYENIEALYADSWEIKNVYNIRWNFFSGHMEGNIFDNDQLRMSLIYIYLIIYSG